MTEWDALNLMHTEEHMSDSNAADLMLWETADRRAKELWGVNGRIRKHGTVAVCQVGELIQDHFIVRGEGPTWAQAFNDAESKGHIKR